MRRRLALAAGLVALVAPAAADAHVQVTPALAATDDAVRFEVLVPNEQDSDTVAVALQIPPDVIPFSFEETPGWKRTEQRSGSGALEVVRWRGAVAPGGFVRFSFLAATPAEPTTVAWKALQTYEGGEVVRWIGDEGSESPAATTEISASAARANAGGEGPSEASAPEAGPAPVQGVARPASDGDGPALAVAITALAFALLGCALAVLRRSPR